MRASDDKTAIARKTKITRHTDLEVYQRAFSVAMKLLKLSKVFPAEEKYSLEAGETQTWLQFAVECGYLEATPARDLYSECDSVIAMLIQMQNHPENWCLTKR
jgi:hypothetical protein